MTKWHHERIHDHEKKKQAVPNVRIYGIIHMYTGLRHRQITHPFRGYQKVRGRERETGTAASAGDAYTIINQSPSARYTYSNSPNIKTSTFSSTYDSFYLPLIQTKPTVLYIHTFPSPL